MLSKDLRRTGSWQLAEVSGQVAVTRLPSVERFLDRSACCGPSQTRDGAFCHMNHMTVSQRVNDSVSLRSLLTFHPCQNPLVSFFVFSVTLLLRTAEL